MLVTTTNNNRNSSELATEHMTNLMMVYGDINIL